MKSKLVLAIILSVQIQIAWAQARIRYDKKGQATPSAVQPFGEEAFNVQNEVHPTFRVIRQSCSAKSLSSKYRSSLNP